MGDRGLSRRALVGGGIGLAAATAIGGRATRAAGAPAVADACSLLPPDRIGLQLYSLSSVIQEQGFAKVLPEVAAIGFKQIEFAGYTDSTGIGLEDLRDLLAANDLVPAGSHIDASDASIEQVLDDAEVLGIPNVGVSLILPDGPPSVAGWAAQAANYNRYGEAAKKRGKRFYMHNHFEEWFPCGDDPTRRGMDVLLAETDPELVDWQCDVYWIHVGQAQSLLTPFDPLEDYILPQRERISLFHVKDGKPNDPPIAGITDVGEGAIDFQRIFTTLFEQSEGEREKHLYLWERDNADDHPRGAMAAGRSSFVNMRYALVPAAACAPAKPLKAAILSAGIRKRRVRVALKLNGPATVTAKLTRGKKTLATTTRSLAAGRGALDLPLPKGTRRGRAKLKVTVRNGTGTRLVLRDTVRVR